MSNRERFSANITLTLVSLMLLTLSTQSFAQSQKQPTVDSHTKNEDQRIICFAYVAMANVEVRNQQGEEIADLRKDDFIIYENGVRQEICFWRKNEGSDRQTQHAMYEVGYYPMNLRFEGEFRKIRVLVRIKGKRKLKVQVSPKGYYAKKELLR